jgi:hypothetical protein
MWHYYPGQYMPSYQVNRALTQAHYGGGEFAEILEVASQITPGDNESFHQAWSKMGNKIMPRMATMHRREEAICGHLITSERVNSF